MERAAQTVDPSWLLAPGLNEQVTCPLCGYDLRGLSEPRCPECGYAATWQEIRDPRRRLHPYLFEQHPEHNLTSFVKTLLGGLLIWRFWRTLHPMQPSDRRRLLWYWRICASVYALALICNVVHFGFTLLAQSGQANTRYVQTYENPSDAPGREYAERMIEIHGSIEAAAETIYPTTVPGLVRQYTTETWYIEWLRPRASYIALVAICPLLWPWLTWATLVLYPITMRRAGVQSIHTLRCALYSFDWILFLGTVLILYAFRPPNLHVRRLGTELFLAWMIFVGLMGFWKLYFACKHYLRIQRPFAMALASQIIVLLAACLLISLATLWLLEDLMYLIGFADA